MIVPFSSNDTRLRAQENRMLPMLVLIADQHAARAAAYRRALAGKEFVAFSASTADECDSVLSSLTPDAVVLDAELEEGPWVLATLAQRHGATETAVIIHSSSPATTWPIALAAFPNSQRYTGPIAAQLLYDHVHGLLHRERLLHTPARMPAPVARYFPTGRRAPQHAALLQHA
jgi:DNA-binding response OmpR family regulator